MKQLLSVTIIYFLVVECVNAQLNIQPGATLNIQSPAFVTVTGNVSSSTSILGTGTLLMNGETLQQLQTGALSIPNLSIKNPSNIQLAGNVKVTGLLNFISGKIIADNYSLLLDNTAAIAGAGPGKFVETVGSGQLRKLTGSNLSNYLMPVGNGNNYTPVSLTTSGTYAGAIVSVKAKPSAHPNKPVGVSNYLDTYWTILRTGINGSVNATATYTAADIIGNEATYKGFLWDGINWTKTGVTINTGSNQIAAAITGNARDIYAMNDVVSFQSAKLGTTLSEGVYPNPTVSKSVVAFNIDEGGKVNIELYDANGKLLHSEEAVLNAGYHQRSIDLSSFRNGVYEVHVQSNSINKIYEVIKQ